MASETPLDRFKSVLGGAARALSQEAEVELAFTAEERLGDVCDFSFDTQLGYLTSCPTNTGTGMRASLMLHLPMIQPPPEAEKQVPPATEWKFLPEPPTQMTGGSYVPCGAPVCAPPCLPAVSFSKKK